MEGLVWFCLQVRGFYLVGLGKNCLELTTSPEKICLGLNEFLAAQIYFYKSLVEGKGAQEGS